MAKKRRALVTGKLARDAPSSFVTTTVRDIGAGLLVLCVVFIAYAPAITGGFVWDDGAHVTRPELQHLHGLWRIWFDLGATQQYYPLLHSAFWVEQKLWGIDDVVAYHVTNLVFHATAAWLVMLIVRRLSLPGAWLTGLIFALHPVCVEAVAWISEQKSTLSAVFYLGSMLAYLGFDRTRRKFAYALALGLFVLALLTKTVTATLPAALLVILWWKRGRLDWKRDVLPLLPWFVLGATAGLFTAWVEQQYVVAHGVHFVLSPLQRVLIAGRAIWFYVGKLIIPTNLTFNYPHWTVDSKQAWQYLFPLGVLAVAGALALLARWDRGPLAAFLFFVGTLFPALGFLNVFPFVYSYVADHFAYLASLGFITPLAVGLTRAAQRVPLDSTWRGALGGLLLVSLGTVTWHQSGMYQDAEVLYRETALRNPASWLAHNNLGLILAEKRGGSEEAIGEYEAAVRDNPDVAEVHNNLGIVLSTIPGRDPDAIAEYKEALRIDPSLANAHNNLGIMLSKIPGRVPDAIAEYEQALRLDPNLANAHNDLGLALSQIPGRDPDAIAEYQAALRIDPELAEAHHNLGLILSRIPDRLRDAEAEYRAVVRIDPGSAEAYHSLGLLLSRIPGRLPDAEAEYRRALRIDPSLAEVHNNLAVVLSQMPGRLPDAVAEYEEALRIAPDFPDAHYNFALALMQIPNRRSEAASQFEAALTLRPDFELARQMLLRLRSAQQ
jgi:protein O-mannosyl-transferase